jgi:hypothetical protein
LILLHDRSPRKLENIFAARSGVFELQGLTVMSTSFFSSKRFDDGSVVLSIEAHPARNAMQIKHAINFFIFITGYLLLSVF